MLLMRQGSPFNFQFFDGGKQQIGSLTIPDIAVATNARLKNAFPKNWTKDTQLEVDGIAHTIEFEHLTRDWVNDLEYRLKQGDAVIASSVYRHKRRALTLETPFKAELIGKSTFFAARFELVSDGVRVGAIFERGFTVARQLWIDLPEAVPRPIQCFLAYIVFLRAFK